MFCFLSVKLIEYKFPALSVCSNPALDLSQELKYLFFLLSTLIDEPISTPKIITFHPNPVPGNEKRPCLSNIIP